RCDRPLLQTSNAKPTPDRHADVNSRRRVYCSGPLDLSAQAQVARVLRTDTPTPIWDAVTAAQLVIPWAYRLPRAPGLQPEYAPATRARRLQFGLGRGQAGARRVVQLRSISGRQVHAGVHARLISALFSAFSGGEHQTVDLGVGGSSPLSHPWHKFK